MNKKFKTKVGLEIVIPLGLIFGLVLFLSETENLIWTIICIAPAIAFIIYLIRNTHYTIVGSTLKIKSAFLVNLSVDILSITQIRETNNLFSAPAASLDRLEITYGKGYAVLISPKEKKEFIVALQNINPSIEFIINS